MPLTDHDPRPDPDPVNNAGRDSVNNADPAPGLDLELDAQLRALAGSPPELAARAAHALVREAAAPARTRRRKRWAATTAALLAAGALAFPTAALAERLFAAQSGEFAEPGQTEVSAGSEWIDPDTNDFTAFVAAIAPTELPAPDGYDWQEAATRIAARYDSPEPTRLPDSLVVADFERDLWLAWIVDWIEADRAGDAPRRTAALDALREAPGWPEIAASDGGGIRYVMWAYVARMNDAAPEQRTAAAQALLQSELREFEGGPEAERRDGAWDGVDRQALIDEVHAEYGATLGPEPVRIDDAYWNQYDVDLRAVATRAGVPDPDTAVGHRRSAPASAESGTVAP